MELYQTFVMTKVCYHALPMSAFTQLQKRAFPVYFQAQTILIVLTAATHPPHSLVSLVLRWYEAVPLGLTTAMAVLNLFIFGPRTSKAMMDRVHQETRDGRKYNDEEQSDEMKLVNRRFSKAHAMSIHFNLIAVLATVWYGVSLGSKLQVSP